MKTQKQKKHTALKKTVSVAVMGSICLAAAFSVAAFSKTVTVDENSTVTIDTMNTDTSKVAAVGSIPVSDELLRGKTSDINDNIMSTLITASTEKTDKVEKEESTVLLFNDEAEVALGEDMTESSDVEIKIAEWVSINVDMRGKKMKKDVPAGTVADALAYLNINITKDDKLSVSKDTVLTDGLDITITRTVVKTITTTEAIDYDVIYKDTDDLYEGESEVSVAGVEGERTIVTKETYINGKMTEEVVVSNEITKEPVDKVVLNGTAEKKVNYSLGSVDVDESSNIIYDIYGNALTYTSVHTGSSTAYTAPYGALTATGRLARYGVVAVNPNIIPYGSILYIVTDDGFVYGYAVAGDTGGFIYNGTNTVVDLYFDTYDECCYFGRRNIHVYVLSGVSEDATYYN